MISIFRKLRKSIIESGSLSRYVLYAVGEIALVVIGILIALQLNNWKEQKEERILEISTLHEIVESLKTDINYAEIDSIERMTDAQKIRELLAHLEAKKPNEELLEELFYYPFKTKILLFNSSAFRLLESRGIDIISNSELRKKIVNHFTYDNEITLEFMKSVYSQTDEFRNYYQTKTSQKIDENFIGYTGRSYTKAYALDYENLLSDSQFLNKLRWRIARNELTGNRVGLIKKDKLDLKSAIELELKRLN